MNAFKQLNLLLSQAQKQRDVKSRLLKEASDKLSKDRQQKSMLQRYIDDYQKNCTAKQHLYNSRESLTNFNLFINKLQEAIIQLTARIRQQEQVVDRCRDDWIKSEIKVKQIEKLLSIRQSEVLKMTDKRLQKENDAFGLTLFLNKKTECL
jgi:flagellar FliJ protein